jgi:hypothetical protein
MLAQPASSPDEVLERLGGAVVVQPKLDGWRGIVCSVTQRRIRGD